MLNKSKKHIDRQLLTAAIEQTADAIFITDSEGVIEYVNPAFETMTGYRKSEAIGKKPSLVKSGLNNGKQYSRLWTTIKKGRVFRSQIVNRKKNGTLFYVDHTINPIKDTQGRIINYVGIWKDITDQKLLEQKKDEFITIASHELKTPITTIKAFSQIIQREIAKTGLKNNSYLIRMDEEIRRLQRLVNDLMDVSRIQTGSLTINKTKVNLKELVRKVLDNYRLIGNRLIKVDNIPEIEITADKERIMQVMINLINNALKYSKKTSSVRISAKKHDSFLNVSIEDKGIGIPESEIKLIFNRYYRAENILESKIVQGMGIGLYLSSEIIRMHNGRISVSSQLDRGSKFTFSLPI